MSDSLHAKPRVPRPGREYSYGEVGSFFQHDPNPLHWVLLKDESIVALRLREDYNPLILTDRPEVWVGADSPTKEWGKTLSENTPEVSLFVKKLKASKYSYMGLYSVIGQDTDATRCKNAESQVPHKRGVSRIVFLQRAKRT